MRSKRPIFYFLTEDLNNGKERNEIEYLSTVGRVVVVSRGLDSAVVAGVKQLKLRPQSRWMVRACTFWAKICYLLCRIAQSSSDIEFPSRNVYTGSRLLRTCVNALWRFKRVAAVNRCLPAYDWTYFVPFRLLHWLFGTRLSSGGSLGKRVLVHDSLILRLGKFSQLIACARNNGVQVIANVKSWDNPFYTQFASGADGYLLWSQAMWADIARSHRVASRACHVWHARPFFNFARACANTQLRPAFGAQSLTVGYAAAFCDSLMVKHEVAVVRKIAAELARVLPDAQILLRPYPTLALSEYAELAACANVRIVDIQGEAVDRYNDGREFIRFGSDEERLVYLSSCNCFLSMATSFTIEAAMFGLPVVHFFIHPDRCAGQDEYAFFQRIHISDHLDVYFNHELLVAGSYVELAGLLAESAHPDSTARHRAVATIRRVGIPPTMADWNAGASRLLQMFLAGTSG